MRILVICSFIFCFLACEYEKPNKETAIQETPSFTIETGENPALQFENLQLFPIVASDELIKENEDIAHFKSLSQAIEIDRFRIVEKKPYGRFDDNGAVNSLTILNKSTDTIFLMAGDVMQGGNQDRVIAVDMIVPPRTVKDIEVFCVEKGRWSPRIPEEEKEYEEKAKKHFAFSGYYNVASRNIRKAVSQEKNQEEVWAQVAAITSKNGGDTETGTYAGLEQSNTFTEKRNSYLGFFDGKFEANENVIGIVAVSGNEVLGTDIFAHPNLFKSKYESLLHSYVTDAINEEGTASISKERLKYYEKSLQASFAGKNKEGDVKFHYNGKLVHLTNL